ncbi:hypothetical protein SETIT_4G224800v2 [Setaria italica]|uniref:Embryo surrounding factor 1 brassicaceae domain-containing protein n=1 Tax=Setaria italica TaxID=4555 RepID=A0A368QXF3_SETIT|nr:hypothetical protein SETIT_4G224800v2 [Setaria italica]
MRSIGSGSLSCKVTVLFLVLCGCLSLPTQCRRQLLKAGGTRSDSPSSLANTSTNATAANSTLHEKKFIVAFCRRQLGDCFLECYCCLKPERCWPTQPDCQRNCLTCDPKCPP